jgi:glyoxylate reductase
MANIYITRKIPEIGLKILKDKGYDITVRDNEMPPSREELESVLNSGNYDAVVTLLTDKIDSSFFDNHPNIKLYANFAIGFDNIDITEAKKRGIFVTNTPGQYAKCVAEHVVALILALTTRIVEGDKYVRDGKYKAWMPNIFIGTDLAGKTLGLIGAGRIGERVAEMLLHGFDMKVLYYDVVKNEVLEKEGKATYCENVEELLKEADIVSLHVPLLPTTKHLINEERLKMMKPTAYLINTARGPVVDEVALVKALKDGVIRGAGLDVFEFEPDLTEGLKELPNVVLTPHIASARESARNEMATVLAENVVDFFEGREPKNNVAK